MSTPRRPRAPRRPGPTAKWPAAAVQLARELPRERLHPAVLDWLVQSRAPRRWAVAFSGGADSLALLLLVWAHWPERRKQLSALHFDHRLRGRDSTNDERFCRAVCGALGIRYVRGRWKRPRLNASEAEARTARHAFFTRELRRLRCPVLWFGHQQDDIAESMLMRLARGSGLSGLAAPRPVQRLGARGVHLRPLLTVKKEEIVTALRAVRVAWREDASNATAAFLRNRMRLSAVRAWCAAVTDRDAIAGAALAREQVEEADTALETWVDELAPIGPDGVLHLRRLRRAPRAVVRRALQRWLSHHGCAAKLSRRAVDALLADVLAGKRTRHSVGGDGFAVLSATRLVLRRR